MSEFQRREFLASAAATAAFMTATLVAPLKQRPATPAS